MLVRDLASLGGDQIAEAARILREAIAGPSYKRPGEAEAEVATFLGEDPERFALAAVNEGRLLGWIGGVRAYSHSLELHPLVVDPALHRQGVGRRLVAALETRAAEEGFLAIHLGTDDEVGGTNLFGAAVFPDALAKLAAIKPTTLGHPFFFYRKLGYEPVGLIPHANGFGKPEWITFQTRRYRRRYRSDTEGTCARVARRDRSCLSRCQRPGADARRRHSDA
jgi:aminoglycoside 6'-N-acetyltransferase I